MDGWDGQSYQRYRGVDENEFSKIIENIENFIGFGGPCYLGISLIIDEENASHVMPFIRMMHDIGVNSVKLSPCIVSNDARKNNLYHRPFFQQVREQINQAKERFVHKNFELFDAYHTLDERFSKNYKWCPFQQILPVIGADQRVYSCQDKAYNLSCGLLGSLRKQTFKEFWFKGKAQFLTIDPSINCNHHCVANSKNHLIHDYLNADKRHLSFV